MKVNRMTKSAPATGTGEVSLFNWTPVPYNDVVAPNFIFAIAAPVTASAQKILVRYAYDNINDVDNAGSVVATGEFAVQASGGYPVQTTVLNKPIMSFAVWASGSCQAYSDAAIIKTTPTSTYTCWYTMV